MFDVHNEDIILGKIQNLIPIKHNPYFWWRRWKVPNQPLHKRKPLLERIENGDFDFSSYFWMAQYSLLELNKLYKESKNYETFTEKSSVEKARYNRLMKDYYKDEDEKLEYLYQSFSEVFIPKIKETKQIINNFDGSLEELYVFFYENHRYNIKPTWKTTIK